MIETVKIKGSGYIVNSILSVPKADGNRYYEEIKKWIKDGGVLEPEFTDEELLNRARWAQISIVSKDCELDIVSGFNSSAIGAIHTYQSDRDDQLNLIGVVSGGADDLFKCHDGSAWSYKPHTIAQLTQVLNDGKLVKLTKLQSFADKKALIEAVFISQTAGDGGAANLAEAIAQVEAIVWQS